MRGYFFLALVAGMIILVDQYTKYYVRSHLAIGEIWAPWGWLLPYVRIVHWYNTGVAFGMFQGMGNIFMIVSLAVAAAIIYYYPKVDTGEWLLRLAMGMQLGGALGNLIDRITIGHVTDFISVGTFAVFNVADSAISVGVVVLLLWAWQSERKKPAATVSASMAELLPVDDGQPTSSKTSSPFQEDEEKV